MADIDRETNHEDESLVTNSNEPVTFSTSEWRIIGLTSLGHALCHISELTFAAVIGAVMAEFELTPDRAAALAIPGFVLYGVGAVPAGVWTDRRGSRQVLMAYFVLLTLAAAAVCLSRSVWQLGGALALLGTAISLYHPAGLTMISHGCQRRGRAMGINGVAGSLGVALGPAVGLYLASQGHWRATYGLVAALSLAGGLAMLALPFALPEISHGHARHAAGHSPRAALGGLSLLFAAMLLGGINYRCLTTALPSYLSLAVGSPSQVTTVPEAASPDPGESTSDTAAPKRHGSGGALLFVILALGGVGQLLGGHLADRYTPARLYVGVIALTLPCAVVMAHGGSVSIPLAAAVLVVFMFAQQPLENTIIAEATPLAWRSTVYGVKFILAFGLASIGAYLTGWVWSEYGLARVFDLFASIGLGMVTFAILFAWQGERTRASVPNPAASEGARGPGSPEELADA